MPPRRSTRNSNATDTSPDPSTPKASRSKGYSKRKRAGSVVESSEVDENAKPQPEIRRARSSRTNTVSPTHSRNSRTTQQEPLIAITSISETSEEEKPPIKKARSSLSSEVETATGTGSETGDINSSEGDVGGVERKEGLEEKDDSPSDALSSDGPVLDLKVVSPQKPLMLPEAPKGPLPRLIIHKLVLVNFKSYAGQQVIGPFHKSFSAIVGPNGSGKSNTIDALLFVFGNRASKLRQGKLAELIHNSANHPNLTECSVEVHFREIIDLPDPNAYVAVPNSELIVSRTAYANSTSKYKINGRSTNREEVTTLLKGKGIDLDHNRFLILQGEVESIAQMKPKAVSEHDDGLLEYLEDIIGTSHYKTHIEEALVEVDRFAELRAEKLNRLRIVEREKSALEDKKKEAEAYLKLQNEFVRAQSRMFQWNLWQCMLNEERFDHTIVKTQKLLEDETERNKDNIAHCEALQKHYDDRVVAYEEVKRHAAEVMKTLQGKEKEEVGFQERKKHATSKAKKLKKSLQEDAHAESEASRSITSNTEKIDKQKNRLEELEVSLDEEERTLEVIRDGLKDKTQIFHDQIEAKQKELAPWDAKINKTKAELDIATNERELLTQKAQAITNSIDEAEKSFKHLIEDQKSKTKELATFTAEKASLLIDSKKSEKDLKEFQTLVQELQAKASSSRQKVEEARASQAASTSQNNVLDSLTRLKNSGRITGFHGRLGSLGTIPDKYDVAISTACPSLNSLVVDQVEQAQACIDYLRKQNVGRANFMVLDKLSSNGMERKSTPENVPRLFDLINPKEPRFAPAFFKGVGNTLVANDLDQANRIAFGGQTRWRVVTLAGQLIDTSGTMSGGGTKVTKGGMSSKLAAEAVSPDVIKRYERERENTVQQFEDASKALREAEANAETLSKKVPKLDMDIQKIELDLQTSSKRIKEAEKRIQDLKLQSKPDKGDLARMSVLDKEMAAADKELEHLHQKTGIISKAIQDLENKILDVGGSKLLAQKSKVDGVKLHINIANEEITKAEVARAKAEKDLQKIGNAMKSNTASLQEVEKDIAKLDDQMHECSQILEDIRSKVEAAQAAAENAKDDLEGIKRDLDEKTVGIQAFRKKEMEYNQILEDANKEKAVNARAIEEWEKKHNKLKLEEIDEEDEDEEDAAQPQDIGGPSVKKEETEVKLPPSNDLHTYSEEELQNFNRKGLLADLTLLEDQLKRSQPNLGALKEYRKREAEFLERAQDLEKVTTDRDAYKKKYDDLRKARLDEFMSGFNIISAKLKEMYQMITLGGNAELELVDSMDPFSEGIIFSVMPPKKSWKNISNLSGGEKTLSSLALVFALHVFKPTPLYFMDEIDAALDFRNVSIVANYIKDRTKNAQFIIISLRNDMFELSHRLIGIYKTSNQTRSISIDNHVLLSAPVTTQA